MNLKNKNKNRQKKKKQNKKDGGEKWIFFFFFFGKDISILVHNIKAGWTPSANKESAPWSRQVWGFQQTEKPPLALLWSPQKCTSETFLRPGFMWKAGKNSLLHVARKLKIVGLFPGRSLGSESRECTGGRCLWGTPRVCGDLPWSTRTGQSLLKGKSS